MDTVLSFDIKALKESSLSFCIPTRFHSSKIIIHIELYLYIYNTFLNNVKRCNWF